VGARLTGEQKQMARRPRVSGMNLNDIRRELGFVVSTVHSGELNNHVQPALLH